MAPAAERARESAKLVRTRRDYAAASSVGASTKHVSVWEKVV
jgi:hypothetical protein